jgi:hypothetical protein
MTKIDKVFHLWGIKKPFKTNDGGISSYTHLNQWEYIRLCSGDRRAIIGLDPRKYTQLEVRNSAGARIIGFAEETEEVTAHP